MNPFLRGLIFAIGLSPLVGAELTGKPISAPYAAIMVIGAAISCAVLFMKG